MRMHEDSRIYNTFDAHRLLHWAELEGKQAALKHALFRAYFTDGAKISDAETLASVAEAAGLDGAAARHILAGDTYAKYALRKVLPAARDKRSACHHYQRKYLISGGQPVRLFERALRQLAAGFKRHASAA